MPKATAMDCLQFLFPANTMPLAMTSQGQHRDLKWRESRLQSYGHAWKQPKGFGLPALHPGLPFERLRAPQARQSVVGCCTPRDRQPCGYQGSNSLQPGIPRGHQPTDRIEPIPLEFVSSYTPSSSSLCEHVGPHVIGSCLFDGTSRLRRCKMAKVRSQAVISGGHSNLSVLS